MLATLVVFLYLLVTLPCLVMLVWVLARRGEYTRLFVGGLLLQLVPVGLLFWPLGLAGVLLLAYALADSARRCRALRRSGIRHPEVERRWSLEYQANLLALAFALEQKAVAWLFLAVVSHRTTALGWLVPASAVLWVAVAALAGHERRTLARR